MYTEQKENMLKSKTIKISNCWKLQEDGCRFVDTIQFFITNRCNNHCRGCFYSPYLGSEDIPLSEYKKIIQNYREQVPTFKKVNILGGEPTLHPQLFDILSFNQDQGMTTTVYNNGSNLKIFENRPQIKWKVRIGVSGVHKSEKPLAKIPKVTYPLEMTYMLRKDNVKELLAAAEYAEEHFDMREFMLSSIRDTEATGDYWQDTEETLSMPEYFDVCQMFMDNYKGNMTVALSKRGIIKGPNTCNYCRFINVFPNAKMTICPFDVALKIYDRIDDFHRPCQNHTECCLQKVVYYRTSIDSAVGQ
jgi:MoaA/NifB/PqqE/SkfB family radical SAM enzyme